MGRTKELFESMRQNDTTNEFIFNKSFDFIACGIFYENQDCDNRVLE